MGVVGGGEESGLGGIRRGEWDCHERHGLDRLMGGNLRFLMKNDTFYTLFTTF